VPFTKNFVPVVDDREVFIGIVRRQQILEHLASRCAARA
jgi:predicted transcriptional regulator